MSQAVRRAGFTLIELLVVVAIIALLISILVPSLQGAREGAKRSYCLANLKAIGTGVHQYSSEDLKDHAVPIHQEMLVTPQQRFQFLALNWFAAWGGRDGTVPFRQAAGGAAWLLSVNGDAFGRRWAANTRPLNKHIYGSLDSSDTKRLELFHCPSDVGYPLHPMIDDFPQAMEGVPVYNCLGNSYRGSFYSIINSATGPSSAFSLSVWGHRLSSIPEPSRVIAFGEPGFFNMIGRNSSIGSNEPAVPLTGWHKGQMVDNLLFADGSARFTRAGAMDTIDDAAAAQMGLGSANADVIKRGGTWRIDSYPSPGAHIFSPDGTANWLAGTFGNESWPLRGYQNLMR